MLDQANSKFNLESNKVGFYVISDNNSFLSADCLKANFESVSFSPNPLIPQSLQHYKSIFLVYDKIAANSGDPAPFKAYKLSEAWSQALYKLDDQIQIDSEVATQLNLFEVPICTEIEIRIKVNPFTRVRT